MYSQSHIAHVWNPFQRDSTVSFDTYCVRQYLPDNSYYLGTSSVKFTIKLSSHTRKSYIKMHSKPCSKDVFVVVYIQRNVEVFMQIQCGAATNDDHYNDVIMES